MWKRYFSTFRSFALLNERTKLNLKYLLTSFSINFDHKLIVGERYVCVFVKVVAKWVDQKGQRSACRQTEELRISFLDQFALGGRLLLSTRRRSIFTAQQQQRGVESCRNAYNQNCKPRCVNNLEIVTKVEL